MKSPNHIVDRFTLAMIPATLLGIGTNIYIFILLIIAQATDALMSPILGTFLFVVYFLLLKRKILNAKLVFLLAAYTVLVEVCIHTYFLGWNSGFFYFLFLLPTVFLLNSSWKLSTIISFNASIVAITAALKYQSFPGVGTLSREALEYINFLNMGVTGLVVIIIMIYFSRMVNKKDEALIDANAELERRNKEISEQHHHQKILLKEIHHRVKNNLQIISSLISLQTRSVEDQDVVQLLNESKRRVEAIALIHQKLYQNDKIDRVNFYSYLDELMSSQQVISANIKCTLESDEAVLSLDTAVPLGLIISEMITNSLKHAFHKIEHPELKISLSKIGDSYELIVHDNGVGLPADFDLHNPSSLGTEIIMALTDQIDAKIEYSNEYGAKFKIYFQEKMSEI